MNKSDRPRPSRITQLALVAAPLLVVLASVFVAFSPGPMNHQQPVAAPWAPAPYLSSDPSLPPSGTYSLPTEPASAVETF